MDKRDRSRLFRERLSGAMKERGLSISALARAIRADRSTVSLILSTDDGRLPNAQVAAECATALGVSSDWLLGLSDRRQSGADILQAALRMESAARAPSDDAIFRWHEEARGTKIRHVPATLPDMLKTEAVLRFEYGDFVGRTSDQAVADMRERLAYLRAPDTDYEIAMPIDALEGFASGETYWHGLEPALRREQLERLIRLTDELYPSLRLYLFDRKKIFSAPISVFGTLQATIYVGRMYLVFRDRRQILELSRHFDGLVRDAAFEARHTPKFVERLIEGMV
ncbi:MAG: transcriptional regulator [Fulvimarina manganoxydans]|uniref:helix-turn-helix domain-containing protein n=1 Tax=Fulvimarina manganoxydans TaxID=937218 RepID=UPI0023566EF3|nr:transcriptional regulator [Fulvimarina manganoxydans]MCK5933686.1 transcriptional regulator [Fulvimarina manganoxydans]